MTNVSHIIKRSAVSAFFAAEPRTLRRGENALESNHIKTMTFDGDVLIIRGQVWASQREKFYCVELKLDKELNFQEASCTCPRGQYLCHHMVAMCLYAHYNVSSTQVTCKWNTRQSLTDAVVTSQEIYKPPKPDYKATNRSVNEEDMKWLAEKLNSYGSAVGYTWLLTPEIIHTEPILLPDISEIVFSTEYIEAENRLYYLQSILEVSEDKIREVAIATTGQSLNVKWLLARKHRLTASSFGHTIAAIKRNSYPTSLFRKLTESYDLEGVKAIQWGRNNEEAAIKSFCIARQLNVQRTGLWLHECGFLGASPDGLVNLDAILEVKCPYKYKNSTSLLDDLKKEKNCILNFHNDQVTVNKLHNYFHQIQGQLYFTKRKKERGF